MAVVDVLTIVEISLYLNTWALLEVSNSNSFFSLYIYKMCEWIIQEVLFHT